VANTAATFRGSDLMTKQQLDDLEQKAKAAGQIWEVDRGWTNDEENVANDFTSAGSPDVILDLIAKLRVAEEALEDIEHTCYGNEASGGWIERKAQIALKKLGWVE
jgi:hypothetical protein